MNESGVFGMTGNECRCLKKCRDCTASDHILKTARETALLTSALFIAMLGDFETAAGISAACRP